MGPEHRKCHTRGGGGGCMMFVPINLHFCAYFRLFFGCAADEAEGRKLKRRGLTNTVSPKTDASDSLAFGALVHVRHTLNHPSLCLCCSPSRFFCAFFVLFSRFLSPFFLRRLLMKDNPKNGAKGRRITTPMPMPMLCAGRVSGCIVILRLCNYEDKWEK